MKKKIKKKVKKKTAKKAVKRAVKKRAARSKIPKKIKQAVNKVRQEMLDDPESFLDTTIDDPFGIGGDKRDKPLDLSDSDESSATDVDFI